jgi:glycosyltransferase involved in cell wall biosynthesis
MRPHIKSISAAPQPLRPWQLVPGGDVTTIGVIDPCYGSSHVIYGLDTLRYQHRTLSTLPLRKLDGDVTFFQFTPFILDRGVSLVHTWNALPLNKDFVVSFELELPRYLGGPSDAQVRRGMRILESDRCKKILALSDFAYGFAEHRFAQYGVEHLASKLEVFRGAVPDATLTIEGFDIDRVRAPLSEVPLSAVVIGTQLFRKGGMYAIQAFERLRARGLDVRLTLIGDFESHSYAFGEGIPDAAAWRTRAHNRDWIRFIGPIPNSQVFQELLAHDLCIYTSLDESLGWLPIEAGMLGVPVIGAAVCAFPELVGDKESGWLVPLPLRDDGRWAGLELSGPAKLVALEDANERLVAGIEACILAVRDDPSLLKQWGLCGRRRAKANYDIAAAAAMLERIYDEALGRGGSF